MVEDNGPIEPTEELPSGPVLTGGRIEPVVLEDEMRSSYLDYAMSVIVGRALPDVRDGLKPVHRRILYSMYESGLRPDRPYRKCASAVGDVMKKYHPHGDAAIYDALVRMGQDFATRYPLIDGHGNFGSIDGDPPAAMRYTEARLSPLAMELLRDIDEDTVDFVPNYDNHEREPVVLPARFPHLLANGSTGIAVGMATNIPPHNLGEVIDATIALLEDPTLTAEDLMRYLPGPDFPTGGVILGRDGIREAYTTGRGAIRVRAVCEITEEGGEPAIVVTEIPYLVNKASLLQRIADLVNNRTIDGIRDIEDHSNREGIRVVITLKRGADPRIVLNKLYKHTQLQDTFGANLLAIVDGVPRTLTLDQLLRHYIDHQIQVITRRTRYRLRRAEERAHIVEGLLVALDHIDEVIALIRAAESAEVAGQELMTRFSLSEAQARAILDMQLRRLARLERQRLVEEHQQLLALIAELRAILDDPKRVRSIIREELSEIRDTYADQRRTRIVADDGAMTVEDLIPETEVVITLTRGGYIKRTPLEQFRTQRRGGRGVRGTDMKDDDVVSVLVTCSTHDHLLVFTNRGRVHRIKAYQVPERSRSARGTYIANVPGLALDADEQVAAILAVPDLSADRYLVFATRRGMVKRTPLSEYDSPRSTLVAIKLRDGDELVGVAATSGEDDVLLVSRKGLAIRFAEAEVRPMGRDTSGVIGMRLSEGDEVLAMAVTSEPEEEYLLVVTEDGYGKRTPVGLAVAGEERTGGTKSDLRYPRQRRGGRGVLTIRARDDRGRLAGALIVREGAEVLLVTASGTVIRVPVDYESLRPMGRATAGVRLMRTAGDRVVAVAPLLDETEGDG